MIARLPLRWLIASPPDRRLLPSGRFAGATPWLIGIMMFVMMIVAATGLALAGGARLVHEGISHRYSIQIADGRTSEARAAAAARAAPGVIRVAAVPEAELRATLEQWLGPVAAGEGADLPLPALIAATPGSHLIRLENGNLVDPTGALRHPPVSAVRA